jgi:hypothetical protein
MFVFGEIQEPLTDTVNLVENIIRSQLVELVSPFASPIHLHLTVVDSDCPSACAGKQKERAVPICGGPDISYPTRPSQG